MDDEDEVLYALASSLSSEEFLITLGGP